MGLLGNIKAAVVGITTAVKTQGLVGGISNLIKEGQQKVPGSATALKVGIAAGATAAAIAGTAAIGAGSVAAGLTTIGTKAAPVLQKAASFAVNNPGKTAVGLIAAPVVVGGLSTKAGQETAVKAPSRLYDIGKDIGELATNPSVSGAVSFAKEHPLATTVTAVAGALGIGSLVSNAVNTMAVRANTKATNAASEKITETINQAPVSVAPIVAPIAGGDITPLPTTENAPITPKKATTKKKKKTKKKKTAKKPKRKAKRKVYKKKTTKKKKKK